MQESTSANFFCFLFICQHSNAQYKTVTIFLCVCFVYERIIMVYYNHFLNFDGHYYYTQGACALLAMQSIMRN